MSIVYLHKTHKIDNFLKEYIGLYKLNSEEAEKQQFNLKNLKNDDKTSQTPLDKLLKSDRISLDKLLELIEDYSKLKNCKVNPAEILEDTKIINRIKLKKPDNIDDKKFIEETRYQRMVSKFKHETQERMIPSIGVGLNALMTIVLVFIGSLYLALNHVKTNLVTGVAIALAGSFAAVAAECLLFILKS